MADDDTEGTGRDLAKGSVLKALLLMAAPMIFGIAAVKSVALTDTLYVGQLGKQKLAALSFAFPVTTAVVGLMLGLSVAAASLVSRAIGEDDRNRARRLSLHTLLLGTLLMTGIAALGVAFAGPLFTLLGASEQTRDLIVEYTRIWSLAIPFMTVAMMSDFITRATGNSLWPSFIMVGGSVFNIALTGLLVFGLLGLPELGIAGAATGTLVAQILTVAVALWVLTHRAKMMDWTWPGFRALMQSAGPMARVALPASLGNMLPPLTLSVVTALLAIYSEDVVAAFGVATQIEVIATIPLLALSTALSPIAGQDWGAGKPNRIAKSLKLAYGMSVGWAALVAVPLWFFGDSLAGLFNAEGDIAQDAQTYLRIVPFSLFGYGMVICTAAAFNGIDHANRSLGFNVVRSAVFYLPLAWIGSFLADAPGVYGGIAIANVVSGLLIGTYALRWLKRHEDEAREESTDQAEPDGVREDRVPAE